MEHLPFMPPGRPPLNNTPPRQRILDAAVMALKAEGLMVNVSGVSKEAHCVPQVLYRFFPGRDALVAAALAVEEEMAVHHIEDALGHLHERGLREALMQLVNAVQLGMKNPKSPMGIAARLISTSPRTIPCVAAEECLHRIGAALSEKVSISQGWRIRDESVAFWRAIVMTADLQLPRAMEAVFQVEIDALIQAAQPLLSGIHEERTQQFVTV
jgi:AcrR family transcriptional regulator